MRKKPNQKTMPAAREAGDNAIDLPPNVKLALEQMKAIVGHLQAIAEIVNAGTPDDNDEPTEEPRPPTAKGSHSLN